MADWKPAFVRTNGIDLAYRAFGAGRPVLFLHGFPEIGYSWRHQAEFLSARGWRTIVPDLRGYGETGPQGELGAYSFRNLGRDVLGLCSALGLERPVLVGHDFGGALAWSIARDYPSAIAGIVSLNTPYTRRGTQDLVTSMREYRGADNYMVAFQETGKAEAIFERDVRSMFEGLMRRPALSIAEFQADPHLKCLPLTLFIGEPAVMGEPVMATSDLDVFVAAFEKTGFEGALSWYRNLARNWRESAASKDEVLVPALMVTADRDFFLPPATTRGMEEHVPDLERQEISDCGHWTQHEQTEAVNHILIDWLERRMRAI